MFLLYGSVLISFERQQGRGENADCGVNFACKGGVNWVCLWFVGQVAQLVEQRTENPCVGGSNPPLPIFFMRV